MRKYLLIGFIILIGIIILPVSANYSHTIEHDIETIVSYSDATYTYSASPYSLNSLYIAEITDYRHITEFQYNPGANYDIKYYYGTPKSDITTKPIYINTNGVTATGTAYIYNDGTDSEYLLYVFDTWNIGSATGPVALSVLSTEGGLFQAYARGGTVRVKTGANPLGPRVGPIGLFQTTYSTEYKGQLTINSTQYDNYVLSNVTLNRNVGGTDYPSWLEVIEGAYVYLNNTYGTSGLESVEVRSYPIDVTVSFGYPTIDYSYKISYYVDGNFTEQTPPITPTPTPVADLCSFWSLAVNTSNILMNEYVQGTLTEIDTSDRYDMIDWYRVMPSGQEVLALHYVYDPGLFGLGAGWFEVTPTGTAYASSLAEALENDIKFTTAGANHLRVKIYDDVSILPLVYHDYDLVCSLDQVVYVGRTTQASNTLGINVKECDTNAMLPYVDISVYDYLTGQWINKTSEMISTTYFNVVPGHNVRILASKSGWLSSDTDYTIPASPGLYDVCLKRPLVDVVNESYVFFNVRDSVTLTGLFQANIQLSDGQIQNTLPSGYAGFSVNDSETYIYTVTKPGYQSFSDSFSVTEDTTIPVKLVQISPTPTLTYPITTLPTVTITGTGTVTPTGTGTGVWSNTTATLSPADKTYKTTKGLDVWYNNIETLSGLLFVAAVFGAIGLISDSMSRRRRR